MRDVGHLLYRSLLGLDANAYPQPDLAVSYVADNDGQNVHVVLGAGHRWSDGHAITTADVVATVAFVQSQRSANHALAAALSGVRLTVQRETITFTLPAPRASFPAALTQLPILPLGGLSAPALSTLAVHPTTSLATSGPYDVAAAGVDGLDLQPNPYAQPRPALASLQLRLYSGFNDAASAFSAGAVDAVLANTPAQRAQLLQVKGASAHDIATFRFVDLLFNERIPGLSDPVVRHAVNDAIDRAQIIGGALQHAGGLPQVDAVSQGLPWVATRNPTETASDTLANTVLAQGAWGIGPAGLREKDGVLLAFTLTVPDADPLPTVARELAQQLSPVGIEINVNVVPAAGFVTSTLVPHAFEIALADWDGGPDPDVSSFWRSNAIPPQGSNVSGGATDPFLDQALDSLATLVDPAARVAAAQMVIRFLAADAPGLFLYTPQVSYVVRLPMAAMPVPRVGGSQARYDTVASWRRS